MSNRILLSPGYFPDPDTGRPLALADIYVGIVDTDPTVVGNQVQLSIQQENGDIIEVAQPLNTGAGGVPEYNGSPVTMIIEEANYSLTVLSSGGEQKYYVPNTPYGTVSTSDIDDLAVTTAKIANLAVTTAKIDNLAVTTGKIAALAVTTAKIADDAVDKDKIAADVAGTGIVQNVDGSLEITFADQATQEAGTEALEVVNPANQQFHSSAAKARVTFTATGVIQDSENVSSITDNGVGDYTVNFTNDFANANYQWVAGAGFNNSIDNILRGWIEIQTFTPRSVSAVTLTHIKATNTPEDVSQASLVFFGDLA